MLLSKLKYRSAFLILICLSNMLFSQSKNCSIGFKPLGERSFNIINQNHSFKIQSCMIFPIQLSYGKFHSSIGIINLEKKINESTALNYIPNSSKIIYGKGIDFTIGFRLLDKPQFYLNSILELSLNHLKLNSLEQITYHYNCISYSNEFGWKIGSDLGYFARLGINASNRFTFIKNAQINYSLSIQTGFYIDLIMFSNK